MVGTWADRLSSYLYQPGSDRSFSHIRLMVNGRAIEFLNGMETVLQEGDEFLMVPFGCGWVEDHLLATPKINKVCVKKGGDVYFFWRRTLFETKKGG